MPSESPVATLLVVDDHAAVRDSLVTLLEGPGRRVLAAGGGAEGLALLVRETVDLVLSDLNMPGMNGLAFLRAVRRLRPDVPCLLMTLHPTPAVEDAVRRGEISECVPKSGDPEALTAAVARALRGKGP
jgi:CheY-like chemotaxis protein